MTTHRTSKLLGEVAVVLGCVGMLVISVATKNFLAASGWTVAILATLTMVGEGDAPN